MGDRAGRADKREVVAAALLLLLVALATRAATFGHPDLYADEAFYFATGVEMRHGAIPFIDVWDRKPVGHFLVYAAIPRLSTNIIAYQAVATLFAAATALAIWWGTRPTAGRMGSVLAGIVYLLGICVFDGHGGQSAVFYNLPMAIAGVIVLTAVRDGTTRRVWLAMLLAGVALTIKTTVVFEAAFFGAAATVAAGRCDPGVRAVLRKALFYAAIGAGPSLLIAAWYWSHGHWDEFWTAMVTSNLRKGPDATGATERLVLLAIILSPLVSVALAGAATRPQREQLFFVSWSIAAVFGFFSVPAFFLHYALPLLVPLCLAAAWFLGQRPIGIAASGLLVALALMSFPYFDFASTQRAREQMAALVAAVERDKGNGPLLVYDGPPLLYTLTSERFPSPLAFPNHLHQLAERDVSHIATFPEMRRILAKYPGAVVMRTTVPTNRDTHRLVTDYIRRNCTPVAAVALVPASEKVVVYGRCRAQ